MNGPSAATPHGVYLDYAATTPLDPRVSQAMCEVLNADNAFGNPSSITHAFGRRAQARVEAARAQVAALIGAQPEEIIFTSGATESNNLAVLGAARANAYRGRHVVTSRIEHKAVLDPCKRLEKEGFKVDYLAPDRSGRIDVQAVAAALRPDTVLVSLMHVNNEIGVIQDIASVGALCAERGIAFHTDAAQSAGKLSLHVGTVPVDFLSLTAHKLYGPKGIGALYVRRGAHAMLQPVSFGGGQERGLRPGTLPVHQIAGFGLACELASREWQAESERLIALRDRLWRGLEDLGGVHLNGASAPRIPGIVNVSFEGVEGESLVTALTSLAVSTGSACSSASGEPSYVLRALGRDTRLAESSLRFSFGRFTSETDIDDAVAAVRRVVVRLRSVSPKADIPPLIARDRDVEGDSVENDLLSPLVRRYFTALPGAGAPLGAGRVLQGEAGGESQEAWVRFHLLVEGDIVKDARFKALGCPHTLAVTAWLTDRLRRRHRDEGVPGAPSEWAETLGVPVEKLGRLLIVEDALRNCLQRWNEEP